MTVSDGEATRRWRFRATTIGVAVAAVLGVVVGLHFWSHTWSPSSSDLASTITGVVPDEWTLVDEHRHDGDIFRFCIDVTCPRATSSYLAPIEPDQFTAQLSDRLAGAGYAVSADDATGCRLPANVSPDSSFPLCRFTANNGAVSLRFVVFSPAVADRRFPQDDAGTRHLVAIEATPD